MTPTDRQDFAALCKRLAFTFNKTLKLEVIESYYLALEQVPLSELDAAAATLMRGHKFFPKPVEWLEAVQRNRPAVFPEAREVLHADGTIETVHNCPHCEDTGWLPDCGCDLAVLTMTHECPLHPYVKNELEYPRPLMRCPCRATNPYFQANHQPIYARDAK